MRALILTADGVEDLEFLYPLYRLREEGITVNVAAPHTGTVEGKHGYPMEANISFVDMWGPDYYDALIFPGGSEASETIRHVKRVHQLIRNMVKEGKVVAAIGHGVEVLVSSGIVEGRKATCAEGVRDELELAAAEHVDEPVVVDGCLITSRGHKDLPDFCREIIRVLTA